jgi:hypothetical protein
MVDVAMVRLVCAHCVHTKHEKLSTLDEENVTNISMSVSRDASGTQCCNLDMENVTACIFVCVYARSSNVDACVLWNSMKWCSDEVVPARMRSRMVPSGPSCQ